MRKFHFIYFLSYIVLGLLSGVVYLLFDCPLLPLWSKFSNGVDFPFAIPYTIPALLSLLATVIALVAARPKTGGYGLKTALTDLAIIVLPALATLLIMRFCGKTVPAPDVRIAYYSLAALTGLIFGVNIVLYRRVMSAIAPTEATSPDPGAESPARLPVSFFGAFYHVAFFLGMALLVVAMALIRYAYNWPDEDLLVAGVIYLFLLLITPAAYCLVEKWWKRSVFVGLGLFALFLVAFGVGSIFFLDLTLRNSYVYNDDFISPAEVAESPVDDANENGNYYHYDDPVYYEEEDYIEDYDDGCASSLSCITGDEYTEEELVEAGLRFAVRYINLSGFPYIIPFDLTAYREDIGKMYHDSDLSVAYHRITSHLYRESHRVNMDNLVTRYADQIVSVITPSIFHDYGYGILVDLLIVSFDDMRTQGDLDTILEKVYRIMQREVRGNYDHWQEYYYELLLEYISPDSLELYRDEYGNMNYRLAVWAYSFWARRYHESAANPYDIYRALSQLQQIYDTAG